MVLGVARSVVRVSEGLMSFRQLRHSSMVARVAMVPFFVTGAIAGLMTPEFLGVRLPSSAPSLGELRQEAKQNLQEPWLGFTAFFTFAIMLSLLVFVFEGVRDAFDPRKTFR